MKKQKGITLVALVITIILLLILSGITIQSITNKGIISNTKRAELENKRGQIAETLQVRLITEQSNNPFGNSEEIISATRESVIENIDEIKQFGKDVTVEDYRKLGTGFRDIRLYETVHMILDKKVDLEKMQNNPNTMEVREQLLTLSGVGPKVADCILLFSTLKRFEVFPIDVWVRRVMNELYIKNEDETKVNKKELEKLAHEKFGNLAGIAQQYLFYWKREA